MIKEQLQIDIKQAVQALVLSGRLSSQAQNLLNTASINRNKNPQFGDYASNVAMILGQNLQKSPREMADLIKDELAHSSKLLTKIEVAGPGFINLTLNEQALCSIVQNVAQEGQEYGYSKQKNPKKILVEFVSANPTGGLHLGHARPAFVGDAVARLLKAAGFDVAKEFYVNDAGNQVHTLARTIHKRYRELFGETIEIVAGEYPAEYVKDIALALKECYQERFLNQPEEVWLEAITKFGVDFNLATIKRSLKNVDIEMDSWFLEHELHESGALEDLVKSYEARAMLYQAEKALGTEDKVRREQSKAAKFAHLQEGGSFLKTSQFGDDEDRIIKRKDGRFVYLTADLAYHKQKFERGYDLLVNVFGADHSGHVLRINAGMQALGYNKEQLQFVLVQMVRLTKNGEEVRFSKRTGEVSSLDDLIDYVGKDVARFIFLMRAPTSQFDMDLDLVMKASSDNPVFYVQYGHARMASILAKAHDLGHNFSAKEFGIKEQELLVLPEEREMLLKIADFAEVVRDSAISFEPHRLIYFCQELIKIFHSYFTKYRHEERIISDDSIKTSARLSLVFALKQTINNALTMLGISAPERMDVNELEVSGF